MATVGVHEAKTHFSKLLRRVATGEEIIITRGGEPVAKLTRVGKAGKRTLGADEGIFEVPDDFNAPLPEELLTLFEK
jgi:prevent-host-death family protein